MLRLFMWLLSTVLKSSPCMFVDRTQKIGYHFPVPLSFVCSVSPLNLCPFSLQSSTQLSFHEFPILQSLHHKLALYVKYNNNKKTAIAGLGFG